MSWDAELFVAIAFLLFIAAVIYFGLHNKINEMLDKRAAAIKAVRAPKHKKALVFIGLSST